MEVKYLDLRRLNAGYKSEFTQAFVDFLNSGYYILGDNVRVFEEQYANFNNIKYCVGVANGLDALILSLKTLGIGVGDEVLVPSNTYIATWLAVSYVGATPIPVEPRIESYNINPERIEEKITSKTKAILPVHLYGQSAEMDLIMQIASKYNLWVVEDNAQAQGATYNGKLTGTWGDINATSFYPGKNLGALGDGGAITTENIDFAEKVKVLRNYGSEKKYHNIVRGINSRLDEIQAVFLNIKLKNLELENTERNNLAEIYLTELKDIGDIILPKLSPNCTTVHHIFPIRTQKRNELKEFLDSCKIGTLIHYPIPPHLQSAYKDLQYKKNDYKIAEEIADTILSIPLFPKLTALEQEYVINKIKEFYHG